MKKLAIAAIVWIFGSANSMAADLAVAPRPAPLAQPLVTWTGCYVGFQGGWKWGTNRVEYGQNALGFVPGTAATTNYDFDGGLAGGTVGCNYQTGNFVFGIEGDAAWTGANGESSQTAFPAMHIRTEENFLATIRGRIGYTFSPIWLVYVTAGGAASGVTLNYSLPGSTLFNTSQDNTLWGWTVGAGFEYLLTPNWTVKVEGLYVDYGRSSYLASNNPVSLAAFSLKLTEGIARVGINYRFNGPYAY
jgi:outer membrane immunogenic protein